MATQVENIDVNFNVPVLDYKGKEVLQSIRIADDAVLEEGAKEIFETHNGERIRIQQTVMTLAEVVGSALQQPDESLKGKALFQRAKLTEKVFLAEGNITLSVAQATSILKAIEDTKNALALMRVSELLDPEDNLGLFE